MSVQIENLMDNPENEEFLVHSHSSIASILRNLMRENSTISAYLPTSDEVVATGVLHVDLDKKMVILDATKETKLNNQFSSSSNVLFDLKQNNVILQFTAKQTQPARFNGQSAVYIELPERLLRLQRREFFRVAAASDTGVTCVIKETRGDTHKLEVEDVSLGGVGALLDDQLLEVKQFKIFHNCELRIPGFSTLVVDLQIRNCFEKTLPGGKKVRRLGLSYANLSPDKENLLQKYINKSQLSKIRKDD
ncbi:MAG: flagellar brake protein [Gammaproteobacteria bacterium]|nr:flagellar brake protein [Gammaproteobacteria bacterium]